MNVSKKDNNFQEMLESFKHYEQILKKANEKFHGEMRSGLNVLRHQHNVRKWPHGMH